MTPQLIVTLLVFAPFAGALIAGACGRRFGERVPMLVTTGLLFVACALAWTTFTQVIWGGWPAKFTVEIAPFIDVGAFRSDWTIRIDSLSAVMLVVVTSVSALVHLYSWGYMADDPAKPRFFAYLSFFTFAMLALVTASDFMQLFFGWEGVGLASYLLIGFWYHKATANAAAIKAFVVNRVGDVGFALGIMTVFWSFHTIRFAEIFPQVAAHAHLSWSFAGQSWRLMDLACVLLFIGAMGKSAQFFLHTWLPDAMEGPTPVSALIHAATMVTAGVYMVCLLSPMFEYAPVAKQVVTVIGAVTCLFAATVGLAQNDIKRVIAYSTCSQLGYMFFAAGVGAYQAAMFHLFTHAFFKALLFLGAGSVINGMHHEQDMRKMGALWKLLPVTYAVMMIGTLAITGVGIPGVDLGFAGFYSKDAIINSAFVAGRTDGDLQFRLRGGASRGRPDLVLLLAPDLHDLPRHGQVGARTRMPTLPWPPTITPATRSSRATTSRSPPVTTTTRTAMTCTRTKARRSCWRPSLLLSIGAIAAGALFVELFVGPERGAFWRGVLFNLGGRSVLSQLDTLPAWVTWAPLVVTAIGLFAAWYAYIRHEGMGARIAAQQGHRLELPLQQVVLRRDLRRRLRQGRPGARRPVLEGRRQGASSTGWARTAWPWCPTPSAGGRAGRRPATSTTTPSSCCWASPACSPTRCGRSAR